MMRHSSGSRAPSSWNAPEPGIQPVKPAQLALRRGDARVVMVVDALRRRRGNIISQLSGARCVGSWARRPCRSVVPVRGRPVTKSGPVTGCIAIPGLRLRSHCMRSRSRGRRMMSSSRRDATE